MASSSPVGRRAMLRFCAVPLAIGVFAIGALAGIATPRSLAAQVRASERAIVAQTADGTVMTINYSRPRARGRTSLFGKTIKWGEIWTPGANWATTLDVSRDISLDGHAIPKGKYSVWFVVRERDWTVILDPRFERYHEDRPDSIASQIRWTVRPSTGAFQETLTWSFPEVRPDGAVLHFAWGPKTLALNAVVRPSHPLTIARADAEPFLGTYEWKWNDSTDTKTQRMELYYDADRIRQRYTPFPDWYPLLQNQPMVRINDAWFYPAIIRDGKLWEMVADMVFEFTIKDGKAMSFEMRDDKDTLLGSGKRVGRP